MVKVSVIVPVYNTEAYVERCLESLINQDLKDIEIVIVNDGSMDGSAKICEAYAKKYPNIKYVLQQNQGLSAARNAGIEVSEGEYIGFVDSDDFVKKDMFSLLYNNAENQKVKISCCGCEEYYDNGKTHAQIALGVKKKYERDEALDLFLLERYYGMIACNKIFKSELFKDIRFPVGRIFEDILTVYKLIDLGGALYYDSTVEYYYYRRGGSLSTSQFNPETLKIIDAVDEVVEFYRKNIDEPKYLYVGQVAFYLQALSKMYCVGKNDKKLVAKIRRMISDNWRNIFFTKNVSFRGKAKMFVMWLSPAVYKKIYVEVSQAREEMRSGKNK